MSWCVIARLAAAVLVATAILPAIPAAGADRLGFETPSLVSLQTPAAPLAGAPQAAPPTDAADALRKQIEALTGAGPSLPTPGLPTGSGTAPAAEATAATRSPARQLVGAAVPVAVAPAERTAPADASRSAAERRAAERRAGSTRARSRTPQAGRERSLADTRTPSTGDQGPLPRTVREIAHVVPDLIKAVIAALGVLVFGLGLWALLTGTRTRRLTRQRQELLQDIGLLQRALLPDVAARVGALSVSVAYRPVDGPAAGGDFYDAFELDDGRAAVIVGDVSGHGRQALELTALIRCTLRAYLDVGLEPRRVLQLAGHALERSLGGCFATVLVAVHDPATTTLRYATAGHPPPILLGPAAHEPLTAASSPPLGMGWRTGLRQTTVALPAGSVACFFTDGLAEARVQGELVGRGRLKELLAGLGPRPQAQALLEGLVAEIEPAQDDMAACVVRAEGGEAPRAISAEGEEAPRAIRTEEEETPRVIRTEEEETPRVIRTEELELDVDDSANRLLERFLRACGIPAASRPGLAASARAQAARAGTAIVAVRFVQDGPPVVEIVGAALDRRRAPVGARAPLRAPILRAQSS